MKSTSTKKLKFSHGWKVQASKTLVYDIFTIQPNTIGEVISILNDNQIVVRFQDHFPALVNVADIKEYSR